MEIITEGKKWPAEHSALTGRNLTDNITASTAGYQQCLKSDSTDIEYLFYCGDTEPVQMHSVSTKSLFTEGRTEHFMRTHSGHDKELCLPLVI